MNRYPFTTTACFEVRTLLREYGFSYKEYVGDNASQFVVDVPDERHADFVGMLRVWSIPMAA